MFCAPTFFFFATLVSPSETSLLFFAFVGLDSFDFCNHEKRKLTLKKKKVPNNKTTSRHLFRAWLGAVMPGPPLTPADNPTVMQTAGNLTK